MEYINDKFKNNFPEHFGEESPSIDGKILYQYQKLDDEYIETILKRSIYVSTPSKFNDPFDCWGLLKDDQNQISEQKLSLIETAYQKGARSIGIACLTSSFDNQLMWAHYASGHTGICIGFLFSDSDWKGGQEIMLRPVQYKDLKPIKIENAFNQESDVLPSDEVSTRFLYSKNPDWHYEKEWRLMFKSKYMEKLVPLDEMGITMSDVIFGMNVPNWKIKGTTAAFNAAGIKPNYFIMKFNRETLRFERVAFNV